HIVLYLVTLVLLVPPLLASAARGDGPDAAVLGALGALTVALMPGALGRCDPPHVLLHGLGASALAMVALSRVPGGRAFVAYAVAYTGVFIILMQLVNVAVFHGIRGRELVRLPLETARWVTAKSHDEFAARNTSYLSALDKYPKLGLPFATWGYDNAAEAYLIGRGRVATEFYVGTVAVYTEADVARKLTDVGRSEYLLLKKDWEKDANTDPYQNYLSQLRTWFAYPARLPFKRLDLNPASAVPRFIAANSRPVENVGPCVVVRRVASLGPLPASPSADADATSSDRSP